MKAPSPRLQGLLARAITVYPPFLGAGIRVRHPRGDPFTVVSSMRLTLWNRNALGTHFGGSLYSMCDPFFVLLLIRHLGPGYVIWDRAAAIEFLAPGRGKVTARFHISKDEIDRIRRLADAGEKIEPVYVADVVNEEGRVVARVEKRLYVRKKST